MLKTCLGLPFSTRKIDQESIRRMDYCIVINKLLIPISTQLFCYFISNCYIFGVSLFWAPLYILDTQIDCSSQ